jgi:tungstate transport system substrate-binding protein
MCAGTGACTSRERPLRLGTTHTVEQSGALALLDSLWRGAPLAVVVAPSGQILQSAAAGNLDVVITHAPTLEKRLLVEPGHALRVCPLVESRFAVVGPSADPARVKEARTAPEAFQRIARARAPFVSRGDSSGTHVRELGLWRAAQVSPRGAPWYLESGADQTTTLRIAEERGAYALADLPTLARQRDLDLPVLFAADTALRNPYTLYVARSSEPHPSALAFTNWATDTWRARLAELRLPDGMPAFAPATGECTSPGETGA